MEALGGEAAPALSFDWITRATRVVDSIFNKEDEDEEREYDDVEIVF